MPPCFSVGGPSRSVQQRAVYVRRVGAQQDRAHLGGVGGAGRVIRHQFDLLRAADAQPQRRRAGDLGLLEDRARADLRRRAEVAQQGHAHRV